MLFLDIVRENLKRAQKVPEQASSRTFGSLLGNIRGGMNSNEGSLSDISSQQEVRNFGSLLENIKSKRKSLLGE